MKILKFKFLFTAFFLSTFFSHFSNAELNLENEDGMGRKYEHITRTDISEKEYALHFLGLYAVQWGFYYLDQHKNIRENGSLQNWVKNPFRPHFDHDNSKYNLFLHPVVGNYYYLFYRSRGYSEKNAFLWTFLSSLAFEFSIETLTERPSFQDIFQTPVLGALVGIGLDELSCYMHSKNSWAAHALGYILNPFTVLPFSSYKLKLNPTLGKDSLGASFSMRF